MKIKKELFDRLKSQGNNIFIKSEKKVIGYDEFLDLVSKSITFIQENFPKKKLLKKFQSRNFIRKTSLKNFYSKNLNQKISLKKFHKKFQRTNFI